jgi:hypothetical protein
MQARNKTEFKSLAKRILEEKAVPPTTTIVRGKVDFDCRPRAVRVKRTSGSFLTLCGAYRVPSGSYLAGG